MKIVQIKTDGVKVGLAAYLIDKQDYIQDPRKAILYRNLEVLKSALHYAGYTDSHTFVVVIKVNDVLVELSKCRVTNDGYIFYHEGTKYYVIEDRERRLTSVGYFGEFPTTKYSTNLLSLFEILTDRNIMNLRKCKWSYNNKVMRFKLFNNTGAINICTITTLIDINNKRKAEDHKAIPFIKDKGNNTLVIFTDKDIYDKRYIEEELNIVVMDILSELKERVSEEMTYTPVEYGITIFYND